MMACSYLSAGGMKNEPTSAACWSPPAMPAFTADTRHSMTQPPSTMSLPEGPMGLPSGSIGISSGPVGLSRMPTGLVGIPSEPSRLSSGPMGLPSRSITLPSGQPSGAGASELVGLPCESNGRINSKSCLPNIPLGLTTTPLGLHSDPVRSSFTSPGISNGSAGLASGPILSNVPTLQPNALLGLPPPFSRPLQLDMHSPVSQPGPSSEPALDLSTTAPSTTSSLKPHKPSSNENTE